MLTSPNGIRGNTTKLKGGMFYGKILRKFGRVLSLSSYILGNASKSTGILDFYETFCKNNDFLTCRGCNLNEFVRILKWYEIFAVLLIS